MPTILTLAEVRDHVESDLVDDALTRLIEDADQEIIDRLGALATDTKVIDGEGVGALLSLPRKATSITSVVEKVADDPTVYTLDATDYSLLSDGFRVERKQGSTYPSLRWRGQVTVAFVPADETASREALLVDLVKLAVGYTGRKSETLGDHTYTSEDYGRERVRLFDRFLGRNRRLPLA